MITAARRILVSLLVSFTLTRDEFAVMVDDRGQRKRPGAELARRVL